MNTTQNRDREILISTVLTGIVSAITLFIYIIDLNKYAIIVSLLISIEAFLYAVYTYFSDIRDRFNDVVNKLENWMNSNIKIGQNTREMYEGAADRARRSTRRFLVIQRTPTLFFPVKRREGRSGELSFKEALKQVIERAKVNHNFEFVMLFSFFDDVFKSEFLSYNEEVQAEIIKSIREYCDLADHRNIYIASLPRNSYSVHPLIISDEEISFWLTGARGERIFVALSNSWSVTDKLYEYYRHMGDEYKYDCDYYLDEFIGIIRNEHRSNKLI